MVLPNSNLSQALTFIQIQISNFLLYTAFTWCPMGTSNSTYLKHCLLVPILPNLISAVLITVSSGSSHQRQKSSWTPSYFISLIKFWQIFLLHISQIPSSLIPLPLPWVKLLSQPGITTPYRYCASIFTVSIHLSNCCTVIFQNCNWTFWYISPSMKRKGRIIQWFSIIPK